MGSYRMYMYINQKGLFHGELEITRMLLNSSLENSLIFLKIFKSILKIVF